MAVDNAFNPPASPVNKMKGSGRSMFGQQVDSQKSTQPTYSFSHSTNRDQAAKMFLSSAHANAENKGLAFKGDSWDHSCVDKQVTSNKVNAARATFSTAERLTFKSSDVPGPGMYSTQSSLGDQATSSRASPPKIRFGSSTRDKSMEMLRKKKTWEKVLDSGIITSAANRWSHENSHQFISSEHQAHERKGLEGPPPGSYSDHLPGATGSQLLSGKRNSPSFVMTKADRLKDEFAQRANSLPAAGQYETWTAMGKQTLSQFRTLPAYGFRSGSNWDTETKRFLTASHTESLKGTLSPANYDSQTEANMTSFGKQTLSHKSTTGSPKLYGSERFTIFKSAETPGPGAYA